MAYKTHLMLQIKSAFSLVQSFWNAFMHPRPKKRPTAGPVVSLYKLEDGKPAKIKIDLSAKPDPEALKQMAKFAGEQKWELHKEDPHNIKKPPPAFKILKVSEEDRRIQYETLYPDVAEHRLRGFGDIQRGNYESKEGVDPAGTPVFFVFYTAHLNVSPNFDFDRALERAVGLENMSIKEAYEYSVQLNNENMASQQRDHANEMYSRLEIKGVPDRHLLVITTALLDFPAKINEDIGHIVHNESATEDGFLRRYYLEVNQEVSLNFAASYSYEVLRTIAEEVVTLGDTWDVWKMGKE